MPMPVSFPSLASLFPSNHFSGWVLSPAISMFHNLQLCVEQCFFQSPHPPFRTCKCHLIFLWRAFADLIRLRSLRSSCIVWEATKSNDRCPYKSRADEIWDTDAERRWPGSIRGWDGNSIPQPENSLVLRGMDGARKDSLGLQRQYSITHALTSNA